MLLVVAPGHGPVRAAIVMCVLGGIGVVLMERRRLVSAAGRAFTLIEILIVVVILGILAAIVVPQFTSASQDAAQAAFVRNLRTFSNAAVLYRSRTGYYPRGSNTGVIPAGFETYVDAGLWSMPTPIGGRWDYEYNDSGIGAGIGVHFENPDDYPGEAYMVQVDRLFDDGDLSTGGFRALEPGSRYFLIHTMEPQPPHP